MSSTTVRVSALPTCNICHAPNAYADCLVPGYAWAYVCRQCYDDYGCSLGTGRGQELLLIPTANTPFKDMSFDRWMANVNAVLEAAVGLSADDIDDYDYQDEWAAGVSPGRAARNALENAGCDL